MADIVKNNVNSEDNSKQIINSKEEINSNNTSISNDEVSSVTLSKDIIQVLVQLINIGQKRGAYTIEESYLAYTVLRKFLNDPKFDKIDEIVKSMDKIDKQD